jgi:hypothetical protein
MFKVSLGRCFAFKFVLIVSIFILNSGFSLHEKRKKRIKENVKNLIGDTVFGDIADNVSGLCDGGAIEAQIFNFAQKLNRRNAVELCSFAPLLQNPCACCTTKNTKYYFRKKDKNN